MTQETLELANELLSQIKRTTNLLEMAKSVATTDKISSNGFGIEVKSELLGKYYPIFIKDKAIYNEVYRVIIKNLSFKLEQLQAEFESL